MNDLLGSADLSEVNDPGGGRPSLDHTGALKSHGAELVDHVEPESSNEPLGSSLQGRLATLLLGPVEVPGLNVGGEDGVQDGSLGNLKRLNVSVGHDDDGIITDGGDGVSLNNLGVDSEDSGVVVVSDDDGLGTSLHLAGDEPGVGQDGGSGLGGEGVVGHLNLLGDLVGEDGELRRRRPSRQRSRRIRRRRRPSCS